MEDRPKSPRPWESGARGHICHLVLPVPAGPPTVHVAPALHGGSLAGLDRARLEAGRPERAGTLAQLKDPTDYRGHQAKSWAESNWKHLEDSSG